MTMTTNLNIAPINYLRGSARSPRWAILATVAVACAASVAFTTLHLTAKHKTALRDQDALQSQRNYDILQVAFLHNKRSPDLALACGAHYWTDNHSRYATLIDQGIHNYCRGNAVPRAACKR